MIELDLTKPPISRVNLKPENKDHVINLAWIFGPEVSHMSIDQKWKKLEEPEHLTSGGYPRWSPADPKYIAEATRKVVEDYNLYELMRQQRLELLLVLRDPETWWLYSRIVPVLPDLGNKGFRLRIDHYLSANWDREDLGWGMVRQNLEEFQPWQGVIHPERLGFLVQQVRKHFEVNDLFKVIRKTNKHVFLAIKDTPDKQMEIKQPHNGYCDVYVPESYWQIEFIDGDLIVENPLDAFYERN